MQKIFGRPMLKILLSMWFENWDHQTWQGPTENYPWQETSSTWCHHHIDAEYHLFTIATICWRVLQWSVWLLHAHTAASTVNPLPTHSDCIPYGILWRASLIKINEAGVVPKSLKTVQPIMTTIMSLSIVVWEVIFPKKNNMASGIMLLLYYPAGWMIVRDCNS